MSSKESIREALADQAAVAHDAAQPDPRRPERGKDRSERLKANVVMHLPDAIRHPLIREAQRSGCKLNALIQQILAAHVGNGNRR